MMLTRRADAPLDFDFAKVVEASKDNPVFYVQYAHARICVAEAQGGRRRASTWRRAADLSLLDDEELGLVKLAAQYSRVIEAAALAHEPHRIAFFLYELAAAVPCACGTAATTIPGRRFLVENQSTDVSRARLELALGIGQIISSGLALMGVEAAEEMR